MRVGTVWGDYQVLTTQQFKHIQQFAKENQLQRVIFYDPQQPQLLEPYLKNQPNFEISKLKIEGIKDLKITQDPDILQGDVAKYPLPVRGLMIEKNIYRDKIAFALLKPKRIKHVTCMTKLAIELAQAHKVDQNLAAIAGMFHDCTKRLANDQNRLVMEKYYPQYLSRNEATYHQYTGAIYLKDTLGYDNEEVFNAIRHHVDGDDPHPLSLIIYLADKLDPSRDYDSSALIALAKKDLAAAAIEERQNQLAYLKEQKVVK